MADQVALVAQALASTMSHSTEIRKPAEDALAQAGNSRGFVEVLVAIIANVENESDLRLSAIINLKRTLQRHWKPRSAHTYTLGDDEKSRLKAFLLGHMEEPEKKVAVQLAVVVADVARREWPSTWDELFPSLMSTIHSVRALAIFVLAVEGNSPRDVSGLEHSDV